MNEIEWLTVPDVSEQLGIDISRVRQLIKERSLLAVRREGVLYVPAAFIQDGAVVKGLPGTLTVLADNRFTDDEALHWLFEEDDSLPGSPLQALRENRMTEVRRRAQALAIW